MKRLLLFCLCMTLFLCGCSYNQSDFEVIRFSTWGSASEMAILNPVIKEFEQQNPGIKVEVLHIPQDYFKKLHLLFASKMEPDVMLINNHNIPVYSKFLCDLDDFIDRELYFEQALKSVSNKDIVYAIPRDCSGLVVYYNKDIFKQCGISRPDENWTIEDMINISKELTNKNHWGISYEPDIYYAQPFMHYFGGGVSCGESFESKKGVNIYKSLAYKFHYAPMPSEIGSKTLAQMFIEGKIAMHISGRWLVPKYRNCANFGWDVVNFPKYAASSDSTGWAISNRSKHKDSAKKLVMFLSSSDSIEKFTGSGLIVPARKDVAYSKVFNSGNPLHSDIFIKSVEKSEITRVDLGYNKKVERLNDLYFNIGN